MKYAAGILLAVSGLNGCATSPSPQPHPRLQTMDIRQLELRVERQERGEALQETGREAARLLWDSGYAVQWKGPAATAPGPLLRAGVSEIELGSRPVGFSLGLGEADARAPGAIRVPILAIRCTLVEMPGGLVLAESSRAFEIEREWGGAGPNSVDGLQGSPEGRRFLAHSAGAACEDLLRDLHLARRRDAPKDNPAGLAGLRLEERRSPATTATPAGSAAGAGAPPSPKPPPVSLQPQGTGDWRGRSWILHNQGNPVLLRFGPDR